MDHRGTDRSIHHDEFEQVARSVGSEGEVPGWVQRDLLHYEGVSDDMLDVLFLDAMATPWRSAE